MTSFLLGEIPHIPTNSMPCPPTPFENPQNHGASQRGHPPCQVQPQEEIMKSHLEMEGSSDHQLVSVDSTNNCYNNYSTNHSLSCDHYVREGGDQHESVKWMPSKMRIMRKIMNSADHQTTRKPRRRHHQPQDQKQIPSQESSNENFHGGIIRVCSACKTTKTPLWRSGPCGPKSLCNACGIRQRKARRAMAAATAINGRLLPVAVGKSAKDKVFDVDCGVPFKKRCRFTSAEITQRKLCFEDTVFPQDEKDAAILLMALSCGLICN